ncbi:hypothetical protein [Riemerella columbina]|uniref:hypothetical protein n=1 Tax=Riemerella columbina TaxID=103810 RepID=UPI00266E95CD|nr:hypothetical protein [Riemerella columbina]WKS94912.1 hypothetical protein NYR17_08275 [Riemerella columbina]
MKRNLFLILSLIVLSISALSLNQCGHREDTVNCFPSVPIQVDLNLNLPAYQPLSNTGRGWMYINEQNSGTRGLIVVRTKPGVFKVYDRNAPHLCPTQNSTLEVIDGIKIRCPEDGAEWILLTGQPSKVAQIPPKTYPVYYDASTQTLSIKY